MKNFVKTLLLKLINRSIRICILSKRQGVIAQKIIRIYLSELTKLKKADDLVEILIAELDALIPEEEKFLIPSFEKGYGTEADRFTSYQNPLVEFDIEDGEKVLDIGSGGYPFPYATHLADLYEEETSHRAETLVRDERPFAVINIENMPYDEGQFDFVYCYHVLEHVSNPAQACEEIMRVGKRGYIETPTRTSDIMLNFTRLKGHHKWYIINTDNTVFFFEWNERDRRDTGCNDFFKMLHSQFKNPFQTLVYDNRKLFVNVILWRERFYYYVFDKSGDLIATNKKK